MDKFIPTDKHIFTQNLLENIDIEVIYTSMVASNKSIFVFGGDNNRIFVSSAEVRRYDFSDQKWHKLKEMPHYLWGATAQIIDDEIFIMGGGRQITYNSYNLVYNINSNSWKEKASLPISRKGLVSGIIDGLIYITGGYQMWSVYDVPKYCYAYNPKNDTWKKRQSPNHYRAFGMSVVIDNFLYVLGGYSPDEKSGTCIKMDRYCPKTDLWESMPDMPRPRIDSVAVAIDSKIFVLCGISKSDYITIDYYDTKTKEWTMSDIPTPQLRSAGVAMISNKIYLTTGLITRGNYQTKECSKKLYELTYSGIKE